MVMERLKVAESEFSLNPQLKPPKHLDGILRYVAARPCAIPLLQQDC